MVVNERRQKWTRECARVAGVGVGAITILDWSSDYVDTTVEARSEWQTHRCADGTEVAFTVASTD